MNRLPRRVVGLGVAVLSCVLAAGCVGKDAVSQADAGKGQTGGGTLTWYDAGHRYATSGVAGTLFDGSRLDLDRWRGHVVVVNFWGKWCGPCTAEAPALEQVYRDNRAAGVRFLGVDIRDDKAGAAAFLRAHHISYPNAFDEANQLALGFGGVAATPTTLVLDRHGRVAARQSGSILYTQLKAVVARALAEPA